MATDRWSAGFWIRFPDGVGTPSQADIDGVALAVLSNFQTDVWGPASNPLKGVNPSSVTLDSAHVTYYSGGIATASSQATQTPVAGTATSGAYHAGAALCATLKTAQAGRQNRGRMYLPAVSPNATASTLQWSVSPPYAAQLKTYFDHINATVFSIETSTTHRVAVVSQVGTGHTTPVSAVRIDSVIDSQRGRSDKFVPTTVASATLA